ncbi:hypothetical protein [Cognatilysobacter bugurensis]|uniref:Secreted protein n=1 Tax=Cognatilysobacter bugurensis TaxID=543356 RepID=A0A918T335_9GAMM|nr:hypothetical protein [Lysobacter bugurensis]GHA88905.1 hypothetical protein GCM10007067_28500 [Lysobacter bugurensis]
MRRPTHLRLLAACAAVAFACSAFAQQPPIERQMSPEQFKAAGLDKLTPGELVQLNAWLNRTVEEETAKAASEAKRKVVNENRGFITFGSNEPIVGRIAGEFRGFGKGRSYTLENGQVWEQVDEARLAGVRKSNPAVRITPSVMGNVWYLAVEGSNTHAKVRRTK